MKGADSWGTDIRERDALYVIALALAWTQAHVDASVFPQSEAAPSSAFNAGIYIVYDEGKS